MKRPFALAFAAVGFLIVAAFALWANISVIRWAANCP